MKPPIVYEPTIPSSHRMIKTDQERGEHRALLFEGVAPERRDVWALEPYCAPLRPGVCAVMDTPQRDGGHVGLKGRGLKGGNLLCQSECAIIPTDFVYLRGVTFN